MSTYAEWYEQNYPFLTNYGLWLRGDEFNTLPAEEYHHRAFRFLITRLSTYRDTAASFSHTLLYQIASSVDNVFPDLAYLPPPKDSACFDRGVVPWLLGTKTKSGPDAFDCIGFSLSIVQELINLPIMLRKSGISLLKSQRLLQPGIPLIILGGASACASSLIWTQDPLVDGIYMGRDQQAIRHILETCRDAKKNGLSKNELLGLLENIPGFIQPEQIKTSTNGWPSNPVPVTLEQCTRTPILYDKECVGAGHLQISCGCPFSCSFCFESWMQKPYHELELQEIVEQASVIKKNRGCSSIELYSFNFNIHREILPLFATLSGLFEKVRMKSQRFDLLAKKPGMLSCLLAVGKTSVTCALEGISWRLRNYLDKNLEYNTLLQSTTLLIRSAIRELKIFLIATGLETDKDFEEFRTYLDFIKNECQSAGRFPRIIFSITPLVRFPMTPLMFEDGCTSLHLSGIMHTMTSTIRSKHFECRNAMEADEYWFSQIVVRAREPALMGLLIKTLDETGYVFYRDVPYDFIALFQKHLSENGIEPSLLLKGIDTTQQTPWHTLPAGMPARHLLDRHTHIRQYAGYMPPQENAPCLTEEIQRHLISEPSNVTPQQLRTKIKDQHESEETIHFLVSCNTNLRGAPRPLAGAILASALMQNGEALIPLYRGFRGSHWQQENESWIEGAEILTLAFMPPGREILLELGGNPEFFSKTTLLTQGKMEAHKIIPAADLFFTCTIESPFPIDERGYFANKKLKFSRTKTKDNFHEYVFSKDSCRKNIIQDFQIKQLPDGSWVIALTPGRKFNLTEFIRTAFQYPAPEEWVRVRVVSHTEGVPQST